MTDGLLGLTQIADFASLSSTTTGAATRCSHRLHWCCCGMCISDLRWNGGACDPAAISRNGSRRWVRSRASSSVAGYAAEHPDDPWPELASEGPLFDGHGSRIRSTRRRAQ